MCYRLFYDYITGMNEPLDRNSPVPLYHQLVETLRYRIATGVTSAGKTLPSLREAASAWGVNLHTIRRAYLELAELGLVEIHPRQGAIVRPETKSTPSSYEDVDVFIRSTLVEARERWGLTPNELVAKLRQAGSVGPEPTVWVVECSESQSEDLASQLRQIWDVDARPWCLTREDEPPDGLVVASLFHTNDVKQLWADRFPEVRFIAIHPDHGIPIDMSTQTGMPLRIAVVEKDEQMASNIAADLSSLFPETRCVFEPTVFDEPSDAFGQTHDFLLFAPRIWGYLSDAEREDGRAFEIRYRWANTDLTALANELAWRRAPARRNRSTMKATQIPNGRE